MAFLSYRCQQERDILNFALSEARKRLKCSDPLSDLWEKHAAQLKKELKGIEVPVLDFDDALAVLTEAD